MDFETYVKQEDQENYHEAINQTLRQGLSDSGWTVPVQSEANIKILIDNMPVGTIWFDTDKSKLVVKTANRVNPMTPAIIEQITSVPFSLP